MTYCSYVILAWIMWDTAAYFDWSVRRWTLAGARHWRHYDALHV